ncbi:MAG: MBL fold metallo-hydrolase, partial [Kiloniellales bacterium]|nr:MBL fold metallo-hydrolase [Kiloniellales bacterium]
LVADSGTGLRSPVPLVEALAGKPVLAVALNCFYDHAGGLHHFTDRACHGSDAAAIAAPNGTTSESDQFVSDGMFSALPAAGYRASDYRMRGAAPTQLLAEGDVIDLGERRIEVLHTPGTTPGSLCLWERETGILFTSDTLYDDPRDRGLDPPDPVQFAESLERLREFPVLQVYGGHFEPLSRARMHEIIDAYFAQ